MSKYHSTFGSDATNDGYYIEIRVNQQDPFSFISFSIDDDSNLRVSVGKGENAPEMSLDTLLRIIETAKQKLTTAKRDWDITREQFDL